MEKSVTRRNFLIGRRSRFGHCSFRTRRLLFHREQFGHTYGRNGKRSGYHPDLPGLCAHARCNREGHRPYRRRRRGRRRIGKRRALLPPSGRQSAAPMLFGSRRQLPKGELPRSPRASPHSMESSNVPRVRLAISTAFIRPLWIGTTGGPKQRLSKPTRL